MGVQVYKINYKIVISAFKCKNLINYSFTQIKILKITLTR